MATVDEDLPSLFSFVDANINCCPERARAVLESIVELWPENERAKTLLVTLDNPQLDEGLLAIGTEGSEGGLHIVMEAAETLAAQGLYVQAREVIHHIRTRYLASREAREWLVGVGLLMEG